MRKHLTALAIALFGGVVSFATQAQINGTSSLTATFQTNVVPGTCVAEILDSTGNASSELDFGDVFKSDLTAKSRIEAFKLNFSNCSGVKTRRCRPHRVQEPTVHLGLAINLVQLMERLSKSGKALPIQAPFSVVPVNRPKT